MKANSYSPALRRVWLLIRGLFFEAESSKFDFVTLDGFARLVVFFYRTAMVFDILRLPILIKLKNYPPQFNWRLRFACYDYYS